MFNKFFPNLCVKVNKLWTKLTKNDEVIDVMEKGSVKVNPTLAGTEALITGLDVEGTKYKNVKVEANPTLAGTEADLTGLEVNGTKYAIPSGGTPKYMHIFQIYKDFNSPTSTALNITSFIVNNSSTALTIADVLNYLKTNGYDGSLGGSAPQYFASGCFITSDSSYNFTRFGNIDSIAVSGDVLNYHYQNLEGAQGRTSSSTIATAYLSIKDIVIPL